MTNASAKTLQALKNKASFFSKGRMPSLSAIHALLEEKAISHSFDESQHTVEYRSANRSYVSDRHDGKMGKKLNIKHNGESLSLDTSDTYYSWKSDQYARRLLEILGEQYDD